ncbi:hypothetical protein BJY04DRAFT_221358 [Aspergillus karnatakaensis]|uniref:uncharacterized protein n=1 Tax=Aspergillus karnatakaensis TaxID=1810916 RepID=UPI003CCD48B1
MSNKISSSAGHLEPNPWVEDPIAIIGIGLRLPGSVRTPQQYWDLLTRKRSGRGRVPAKRYNVDAIIAPKGKPGHTCTDSFWSMPPKELELLDPQQRLMMEVVYECLESSGTSVFRGKDIGCYVGVLGEDWMDIQTKDPHHHGMHRVGGYGDFAISNRVSKELGLTGPSMTIRTACSSSLMALHAACQALYAGDCSSAIVGGCNLILSPRMTVTMSEHRVVSPTGQCRSFDASADGYARGEAVNAIHIKGLSSALRDGDPVRSVIRSVCINSDGERSPLFIPSPESHELLIRRSHQLAGITDLSQTAMIECHGTGTMVGDTLEGRAVAKVFGELGGVLIGSVKPNIGHSEGASGLSSVIKMVLALENQMIPPNINFSTPNPKIFLELGPHSALSTAMRDISSDTGAAVPYIPTLLRDANSYDSMLHAAGRLFQHNAAIDLSSLCPGTVVKDLPPYPWHHDRRFWSESRVSRNWRFRKHPHHDILGSQIPDGNEMEPTWRSVIYLENVPWLRDHVIECKAVFPRAGYISMAGEAIRQLTGDTDFSLRKVTFLADITLVDNLPTEFVTQFRPSCITNTNPVDWYDFTVAGHYDGTWTKLCTGQARGGRHIPLSQARQNPGPRKVKTQTWYRAMKRLSLNHGPRFRALQRISASVSSLEATAEVNDMRDRLESPYHIHPCTIDSIFQLSGVARAEGLERHFNGFGIPTRKLEHLNNTCSLATQQASVEKNPTFILRNTEFLHRQSLVPPAVDSHAGARLVWQPDIDDVETTKLIRPISEGSDTLSILEELALACGVEVAHQNHDIAASLPHYAKYREWLSMQWQRAEKGEIYCVPSSQKIVSMSSSERIDHIEALYQRALETNARHVATAVNRVYQESGSLFKGRADALGLLLKDDLLTSIYGFAQLCDYADFFRVFAHNQPTARVLEIGAGTGGVTATILPAMCGPNGDWLYRSYTYTDISAGFFDAAQKRFAKYDNVIYRTLNITADLSAQGFDAASYDLIIASNVLHATPNLQHTLSNVKTLLRPNGKLFLQELAPVTKWINYVMGTLPGWWLGEADGRQWEPYVPPERWNAELRAAGLSGADAVIHDGHMNAHIISSLPKPASRIDKRVTILCETSSAAANLFHEILQARGYTSTIRRLADELPDNQLVISLLELDAPQLHLPTQERYLDIRNLLTSLDKKPMLWVTRSSQIQCSDPRYASTLGLLRTARRELGVTVATLELDSIDEQAFNKVLVVADRLLRSNNPETPLDPVLEYACVRGTLMVGKFYSAIVQEELLYDEVRDSDAAVLRIRSPGNLKTLSWGRMSIPLPTSADDWVEVQPRAFGVNLRDLSAAQGLLQDIVLGRNVLELFITLTPASNPFVPEIELSYWTVERWQPGWTEVATIPLAFTTAFYSLVDVARLKYGDTVLIHSATYAVGLAALQVCRMIGAEVYCTVRNGYLAQAGISRDHVFLQSDITFRKDLLAVTNGRGCVTELGTMVDLSQRDLIIEGQRPLDTFNGNRIFATVDLGQMCQKQPEKIQGLLRRCMHHYALGEPSPLPVQEFPTSHTQQAFHSVQADSHIGKTVIMMPEDPSDLSAPPTPRTPAFRSDAMHIFVGGLGGLGRSVSSWMALHGARHFVFFSPSAGTKEKDDFVLELRAQGCVVDLVSGDVSNEEDVDAFVRRLDAKIAIAGVMQASMALEITSRRHRRSVDFFVLFSSLAGLIGQTGHANYAAANAFLDAFVQYRQSMNLPCSVVNIGVMGDVGYVSTQPQIMEHFKSTGTHMLREQDLLDAIQLAVDYSFPSTTQTFEAPWPSYVSRSQIYIGLRSTTPLDSPRNRTPWRRDPRMALYHNIDTAHLKEMSHNERLLAEETSAELLGLETGKALFNLMLRNHAELDLDISLASLGADSLLAIKLRDWFRRKLRVNITVVQVLSSGSLRSLGRTVAQSLAAKIATGDS